MTMNTIKLYSIVENSKDRNFRIIVKPFFNGLTFKYHLFFKADNYQPIPIKSYKRVNSKILIDKAVELNSLLDIEINKIVTRV